MSGQTSTHSCVWLLSVGQSWRAACVHKTHSRRAWLQDPEPSSGVMTLTGPGLHQQPVAGLGLAWEWVSSQLHHRVTRDTWPQLRQLVVTQRKGRRGYHVSVPPSAPLSATGVINRQGEGCPVMRERGTCDSGDNTAALLKPGEGKLLTIYQSNSAFVL